MKRTFIAWCLAFGSNAFAGDPSFGTKADVIPSTPSQSGSISLMPLLQMALAVAVVLLLLKVWIPKLISKTNKGIKSTIYGNIRVEVAATFAGGTLNVVHVQGRTLLLCVGAQGVTFLADLTEKNAAPEKPTFLEMLDAASNEPLSGKNVESPNANCDSIEAALTRARILSA